MVFTRGYDATFGDVSVSFISGENNGKSVRLQGCCNTQNVTQGKTPQNGGVWALSISLLSKNSTHPITPLCAGELVVMNVGQNAMSYDPVKAEGGGIGFGIAPNSTATMRVRFTKGDKGKFAISFVSSC